MAEFSSVKPCFSSSLRDFMMFQTSGAMTGSVRLETLMVVFCCAPACGAKAVARAKAAISAIKRRRKANIDFSP